MSKNKAILEGLPMDIERFILELTRSMEHSDKMKILKGNKTWRKKNHATNVLSFPIHMPIKQVPKPIGDIVICADLVASEAKEQNKSVNQHYAHLIIHGILHLLGYDHKSEEEAEIMEKKEINILNNLGYDNPYEIEL